MGLLARFNLKEFTNKYDIKHLIETGSYYGDGIFYARSQGYSVESCEINNKFNFIVKDRFANNDYVRIDFLPSYKFLQVASEKLPSLYWLDAHLPELYHHNEEGINYSSDLSTPLEKELKIIKNKENFKYSIIIIDDLRMYEPNLGYQNNEGNKPVISDFKLYEWCLDNMGETHYIFMNPSDEGYLILLPMVKYTKFIEGEDYIWQEVNVKEVDIMWSSM